MYAYVKLRKRRSPDTSKEEGEPVGLAKAITENEKTLVLVIRNCTSEVTDVFF